MAKPPAIELLSIDGRDVRVTNPDKPYFSVQTKLSKLDIVRYYLSVASGALTGIRDRPLVLKRFVNGAEGEAFYQKRAPAERPEWLRTTTLAFPSGRTAEEILFTLPDDFEVYEKTAFSSCGAEGFVEKLTSLGINQVVICGLETHICVSQTAHDLLERGFGVHVMIECVCSRFEHDKQAGLFKMRQSGVVPSSMEMAFFELMRDSKHEQFKAIQELIR